VGELRTSDLITVREQLGREPTTPFTVVARCPGGHPLVIRNEPFGADGEPFPTLFWLTCPAAVKAVSRVESGGEIARFNDRAESDASFAAALEATHREYAQERARGFPPAREHGGVGGTREGVKCLHAHYANHLAGGDDVVGTWVAEHVEPVHDDQLSGRVAAVDLGTNSIRLLVASSDEGGALAEFARDMVITRIGQGVDETGRIDPSALERTVAVLARYCRQARALHAERIRVSATSAVRDAGDREELERAVREHSGEDLRVIDGELEAALSFSGSIRGLDDAEAPAPFLVMDIGGGSTEFVIGTDAPEAAISTQMGSVRLTERFVSHDPPLAGELDSIRRKVIGVLSDVERAVPVGSAHTMVAVAGTATTLQAISMGLERYDPDATHRTWLSLEDAERVLARLASMTTRERSALSVMAPGRGDVIVTGAIVLVEALRRFGFERVLISETDILDGLAFELLETR
jgi:exopolyphosphatase / guanosine-5'-triphosphate,3'-diphosphate pyrophosphatase